MNGAEVTRTHTATDETVHDVRLEGGCVICDGALDVRITGGGARTYCRRCRWLSRPRVMQAGDQIHLLHPAGAIA